MVPTIEASQSYHLIEQILGSIKNESTLDKHVRILGPTATSKTTILNTFLKKFSDNFNYFHIPMSSYLTLPRLKDVLESHYTPRRRNQLELINKDKRLILVIDDVHLQGNMKFNLLEFMRTFCIAKGYYDLKMGLFKNITGFGALFSQNSEYRTSNYCKNQERSQMKSRFLFYTCTLYHDDFE